MPPSVTIVETLGQPTVAADADYAVCVIGYSSANPFGAGPGPVSPAYSSAAALAAAYGLGDAVDCATQAISRTPSNPRPPPISIYPTPATTPGVRGTALATSGVAGGAVVSKTPGTAPKGTYQPAGRVVTGGTLGTAGIVVELSPEGRTWLPSQALGTGLTVTMLIGGIDTGVGFTFAFDPIVGSADVTAGALYGPGGTLDTLTLKLNVNGGGVLTLTFDGLTNTANQAALLAAIEATWPAVDATVVATNLQLTLLAGGSIVIDPSSTALVALGLTAGTYTSDLVAGDIWYESKTTPPQWALADLYSAGPPAAGALAKIAEHATSFAIVAISEPVQASDIPTLSTALNYFATVGKDPPALLVRFRDPNSGETDAQYVAAFQLFRATNHDNRIACVVGSGWLTDAFRGYRYFRSGMPAVLARMQSFAAIPGSRGEKIAQHPGFVARGPLDGFTLIDDSGVAISQAHDEGILSGIEGPIGGAGGGICFYQQRRADLAGTYISDVQVMFAPLSRIIAWPDRRVANRIEAAAASAAWLSIGGADVYDPETLELDPDVVEAMQNDVFAAISTRYPREFQNATDPGIVSITPTVAVSGSRVSVSGTVTYRPYGYTWDVTVFFTAERG